MGVIQEADGYVTRGESRVARFLSMVQPYWSARWSCKREEEKSAARPGLWAAFYFAMVMLGTPLRETSVTVIWKSW